MLESNQHQLNEFHLVCFHQLSCTLLSFIQTVMVGLEPYISGSWCTLRNNLDDFRLLYDMTILIYELEGDTELVAERRQQTYSSSYIFYEWLIKVNYTSEWMFKPNHSPVNHRTTQKYRYFCSFFFKSICREILLLISTCSYTRFGYTTQGREWS